jgi:hypothetical protein
LGVGDGCCCPCLVFVDRCCFGGMVDWSRCELIKCSVSAVGNDLSCRLLVGLLVCVAQSSVVGSVDWILSGFDDEMRID